MSLASAVRSHLSAKISLTLAVLLAWPAFGPYMALMGRNLAYEPAALAILSFLLTWGLIGLIQFASRRIAGQGSTVGGTH